MSLERGNLLMFHATLSLIYHVYVVTRAWEEENFWSSLCVSISAAVAQWK